MVCAMLFIWINIEIEFMTEILGQKKNKYNIHTTNNEFVDAQAL